MIRNQQQLRIAQKRYEQMMGAAQQAPEDEDRQTYADLANELKQEIDEYVSISIGTKDTFDVASIDDLAGALIKARIARNMTQAELAEILNVAEQMVQRDESGGYERATLVRLADVADALEYGLSGRLAPLEKHDDQLVDHGMSSASIIGRLVLAGATPAFHVVVGAPQHSKSGVTFVSWEGNRIEQRVSSSSESDSLATIHDELQSEAVAP